MESLALHQICSIMLTLQNIILDSPLTCISFSSIVSCAFILGRYTMAAKKEKELSKIILEQVSRKHEDESKHREELERKDKEIANRDREIFELRKENLLLRQQNTTLNNSP